MSNGENSEGSMVSVIYRNLEINMCSFRQLLHQFYNILISFRVIIYLGYIIKIFIYQIWISNLENAAIWFVWY